MADYSTLFTIFHYAFGLNRIIKVAMKNVMAIILAAGKGSRMRSSLPKPMHKVAGMPLLQHALRQMSDLQNRLVKAQLHIAVVHGFRQEAVVNLAKNYAATPILQSQSGGTAHALQQCRSHIDKHNCDAIIVVFGDTPFVSGDLMVRLLESLNHQTIISIGAFESDEAGAYGRIVLDRQGMPEKIIEAKDASPRQLQIRLCNGGCMALRRDSLPLLEDLDNHNHQHEYMLPHMVAKARGAGFNVAMVTGGEDEFIGVNSPADLAACEALFQRHARRRMLDAGVRMISPDHVFFSGDTEIAADVVIEPYVYFGIGVKIASAAHIRAFSYIEGAQIGTNAVVGPFARIRAHSQIGEDVKIGNFTEIKNCQLGAASKASHLSYLGDAVIGSHSNIGAGVITCNYDGKEKHPTHIGDGAFIGANAALIAPLNIGKEAKIAAASAITDDVGDNELAIARCPQKNRSRR